MHPNVILNIKPPIDIQNIINEKKFKNINLYVDFKNTARALFVEDVMQEISYNSSTNGLVDSNIFQSILLFSSTWKKFALSNNINFNIYFTNDEGKSEYHCNIDKEYKANRIIGNVNLPDYYEDITKIRRQNLDLSEYLCNKIPNIYFFNLRFLESDFLSYYLITRKFNNPYTLHIIFSGDKDLYQCLKGDNVYLIFKRSGEVNIMNESSVIPEYIKFRKLKTKSLIKKNNIINKVNVDHYVSIMAITGDLSDNIKGVRDLGPIRTVEAFGDKDMISEFLGDYDDVVGRIVNGGNFINNNCNRDLAVSKSWKKIINNDELITKNYKLMSFEVLCRWLEKRNGIYEINKLDYIENILNKSKEKNIKSVECLMSSLNQIPDMKLTENDMKILF